jgi:hypothetical protein
MAKNKMSEAVMMQALAAYEEHGSSAKAAAALGLNFNTYRKRRRRAIQAGLHLSDGVRASIADAKVTAGEAHSGWIVNVDPETGSRKSTYWQKPVQALEDSTLERIREAFEGLTPAPVVSIPEYSDADLLTIYPLADVHMGLQAWGKETGEDYDTQSASERVKEWVAQCVAASPASRTAVILSAGDLTHADDQTNMTRKSSHILDVDTRHFKTIDVTIATLAAAIESASLKHEKVDVRIIPGNHDPFAYMAVLFALAERYKDNPRIKVQKTPGEWFIRQHGKVMLAAHHGDKAKAERMVHFIADQFAELWGKTRHRFLFTGHLHHHKSADIGGVQWEQLRAVTARDAYAVSHGYTARAQLQAITFHRDLGEVSRVKVNGH